MAPLASALTTVGVASSAPVAGLVGPPTAGAVIGSALPIFGGIAKAASVLSLVGTAGELIAGGAERRAADVQSQLAQQQAAQEQLRSAEEEKLRRLRARQLVGTQRAQYGAAGVDVGAGTPLLVMADTLLQAEEDVQAIRSTGQARVSGFQTTAQTFKDIGRSRQRAGMFRAGSTLLSGIGNLAI